MFERQRIVLKRRVTAGNGGIPRILRIRKKADIGEFEITDDIRALKKKRPIGPLPGLRVDERDEEKGRHDGDRRNENGGFSHHDYRYLRVFKISGVTAPKVSTVFPLWSSLKPRASDSLANGTSSLPIGPWTSLPPT